MTKKKQLKSFKLRGFCINKKKKKGGGALIKCIMSIFIFIFNVRSGDSLVPALL